MSELAMQQAPTVMQILADAVMSKDVSIDIVERLVAMQRQMGLDKAELEFNEAMNRCQSEMKRINANMMNPQTHSRYADYAQIDKAIRPIYTKEGFSLSFSDGNPPALEMLRVICYVSRGGYTRMYQKDMPIVTVGPQGKAVMTPVHATGSANAYAKRYLVKDIFNLAIGEDDDDGNGGDMPEAEYVAALDNIANASTADELKRIYMAAYKVAVAAKDKTAMAGIVEAKDKRKGEL